MVKSSDKDGGDGYFCYGCGHDFVRSYLAMESDHEVV